MDRCAPSGNTNVGTWKLNAKGFCTSWKHAKSNCFTVVPNGENKWSIQHIATTIPTTVAVWSKPRCDCIFSFGRSSGDSNGTLTVSALGLNVA
jgi:hypothetical protein